MHDDYNSQTALGQAPNGRSAASLSVKIGIFIGVVIWVWCLFGYLATAYRLIILPHKSQR